MSRGKKMKAGMRMGEWKEKEVERDEEGGSGGSGAVQGQLAGFQPGCLDGWYSEKEAELGGFHRPDDTPLPSLVLVNPPISQMEIMKPEEVQRFTQIPIMPHTGGDGIQGSCHLARGLVYSPGGPLALASESYFAAGRGWGLGPDGFVLG